MPNDHAEPLREVTGPGTGEPAADKKTEESAVFVMPGPAAQVADEVAAEGVEGRPGDVRAGPRMLWSELLIMVVLVVGAASGVGIWLGWQAGLAVMAVGTLALLLNPVVGATLSRARERDVVAHRHTHRT